ncbi:sodium-translocating pyrophosphatase [Candidatus Woesearchaeota archaeon]|nr:sodium-translocating pyrophosphatase [Candidatus Woesearchaeota archaeon]
MLSIIFISIILSFLVSIGLLVYLLKQEQGTKEVKNISLLIQEGATTFLNRQYIGVAIFVVSFCFIIFFTLHSFPLIIAFILGALFSALAGRLGMTAATKSNGRTAWACEKSEEKGMKTAFFSGSVMSFLVIGLSLLGITLLFLIFGDSSVLFGFGFGASSIALFARVAGGIYTKSADIGADLVGKVEKKLPEDDPRNPAVIADLVGDNVGDVAGMGADLFESYSDAIIAAIAISSIAGAFFDSLLPLLISSLGVFSSVLTIPFVKGRNALTKGIIISSILMAVFSFIIINSWFQMELFYCILTGLVSGIIIGFVAIYYTSYDFSPTKEIVEEARTGPATAVLAGLGQGMMSSLIPIIIVSLSILISYHFASIYGIAIAAVGMLSTLGITLAIDSYGPVVDNAEGISEMAGLGKKTKERASRLDAIGNSTAALGKGFAIGSAALTALVLFVTYSEKTGIESINITNPGVVAGLLIGAVIPFIFSSMTIKAVSSTAAKVIEETRKQFEERIKKGEKPLYNRCVSIVTNSALKKMSLPTLLAIFFPIIIGLSLGKAALGGFLAGSISCGFVLALTMANSGGALDNAKKYIEDIENKKGTPWHSAAVVGDTVGDPLKDCAGPSLNILLKLMTIVSLVFFPLF